MFQAEVVFPHARRASLGVYFLLNKMNISVKN